MYNVHKHLLALPITCKTQPLHFSLPSIMGVDIKFLENRNNELKPIDEIIMIYSNKKQNTSDKSWIFNIRVGMPLKDTE